MDLLRVLASGGDGATDSRRELFEARAPPSRPRPDVASTRAMVPPPPTEPFPTGRELLNALLPNLRASETSPNASLRDIESMKGLKSSSATLEGLMQLMENSASRIEAAIGGLTERVDALEQKLDDLVSDRIYSVSCSSHEHVAIEATPPVSPISPVTPIPSPCLVRASPSPSLVNAFAELYA